MQRRVGIAALFLAVAGIVGVVAIAFATRQPTFTCSTTNAQACADTEQSIRSDPELVFYPSLPSRLVSVDIRPNPPDWSFNDGGWAAVLTMEGRDPITAVCYYGSDDMVTCQVPG